MSIFAAYPDTYIDNHRHRTRALKDLLDNATNTVIETTVAITETTVDEYRLPNINDIIKTAIMTGVSFIPYVGGILSALIGLLWPKGNGDTWDRFRVEIEKIIDLKIEETVYSLLRQELVGLGDLLGKYIVAIKGDDKEHIRTIFTDVDNSFIKTAPSFMNHDYEWLLGPLFAVFSTLHITLLRDCVVYGKPDNWGWAQSTYDEYKNEFDDRYKKYLEYMKSVRDNREKVLAPDAPTSPGKQKKDIYNYWQKYHEQSVTLIEDYEVILRLLYGDPAEFSDVFSRAYGSADSGYSEPKGRYNKPTKSFNDIYVETYEGRARAVTVTYPTGQGPHDTTSSDQNQRVDSYDLDPNHSGNNPMHYTFPNPESDKMFNVVSAQIWSGDVIEGLKLKLENGTETELWRRDGAGSCLDVAVPGRMLTTFTLWACSGCYHNVLSGIVLGFSYDTKYQGVRIRRLRHITAIQEPDSDGINEEWQTARKKWWDYLEGK